MNQNAAKKITEAHALIREAQTLPPGAAHRKLWNRAYRLLEKARDTLRTG